ncbi:hypothetical protein ElyMa_007054900 [Elysia marginata]|uniref:ShKT domain-containing protein n=1 Tax=Elysia marginata TaxID=1093978 RepID=A0AAV4JUK9_9GAST|nr:hypothetical protein ElyMa_007054900 [Elysia marginata]
MKARHQSRNRISCYTVIAILVTSLARGTLGCFPVNDVFKASCSWSQPKSVESRLHVDVCRHSPKIQKGTKMVFIPEGENTDSLEEADCASAIYTLDEHVLVADDLDPVKCPLSGGYQVLMHLSESIPNNKKCLDTTATYKPHLQFQCDLVGSPHVLADLGSSCLPGELQMSPAMQGESMAHLECVDSWQEKSAGPTTTNNKPSTTVLMRMKASKQTFWCLHVQRVARSSHTSVSSPEESLYRSLLTFDGRCLTRMNGQHSVPKTLTMFGHLAAFRPGDDIKCKEASYLDQCNVEAKTKCQESTDCPRTCGRCLDAIAPPSCSIPERLRGNWEPFSEKEFATVVGSVTIRTPNHGEFTCHGSEGENQDTFALVQVRQHATCVPYHTCVKLEPSGPGLLIYQMFPAKRSADTGAVMTCMETIISNRQNMAWRPTETFTLVQKSKLQATGCAMLTTMRLKMHNADFDCQLIIHECTGDCHTFNISLDPATCDNMTAEEFGLMTTHTCLAVLAPRERAIRLTRCPVTGQYLCWIQLSTSVFILGPEKCNEQQIDAAMDEPSRVPNAFDMLKAVKPKAPKEQKDNAPADSTDGSAAVRLKAASVSSVLVLLSVALSLL